jgi:hypothetical protein
MHKHRNLLAHAPERLHDEVTADYDTKKSPRPPLAASGGVFNIVSS